MTRPLHIIHTVASLGISAGGPSRTVPALCAAVQAECPHISVEIVTSEQPAFGPNVETGVPTFTAASGSGPFAQRNLLTARIERALESHENVLLHDHGQWLEINRASASVARTFGLQRIISPRGMLTPWAMRHHAWKKRLAWLVYARRDLLQAAALHATSEQEAQDFKSLGARQPIAIIPNGVSAPDRHRAAKGKTRTVVFLSRLHPKKGVQELVAAWRALAPASWQLLLAGPDEVKMLPQLSLNADNSIQYVGEVEGNAKWDLLEAASVVILPSHSENFGVVVAEALMAGTPVIATRGTPWQGLTTHRCGWWIPLEHNSLVAALRDALARDPAELAAMGQRGKAWVAEEFTWPAIGRSMGRMYDFLVGKSLLPPCVNK